MIDLYKLPMDFPGKAANTRVPENPTPYVEALEKEFAKAINDRRFIPYIQLHEYEALLFVDLDAFAISFDGQERAIEALKKSPPRIQRSSTSTMVNHPPHQSGSSP